MFFFAPFKIFSQDGYDSTINDLIKLNKINDREIFSDSYNEFVIQKLKEKQISISDSEDYPRVFFTNDNGEKYLKIWGGPDLGFSWFFVVGYTPKSISTEFGTFIDSLDVDDFVGDADIRLGQSLNTLWAKAHLLYFRNFSFEGVKYFYFEKGTSIPIPYTPSQIFYYKFKNDVLVEFGVGHGINGFNPMLQPE